MYWCLGNRVNILSQTLSLQNLWHGKVEREFFMIDHCIEQGVPFQGFLFHFLLIDIFSQTLHFGITSSLIYTKYSFSKLSLPFWILTNKKLRYLRLKTVFSNPLMPIVKFIWRHMQKRYLDTPFCFYSIG